jgi:hypothetical protein
MMQKALNILDAAAAELAKAGFDNRRVSEMFFAYGLRIGAATEGVGVFEAAREIIDGMEKASRGAAPEA